MKKSVGVTNIFNFVRASPIGCGLVVHMRSSGLANCIANGKPFASPRAIIISSEKYIVDLGAPVLSSNTAISLPFFA